MVSQTRSRSASDLRTGDLEDGREVTSATPTSARRRRGGAPAAAPAAAPLEPIEEEQAAAPRGGDDDLVDLLAEGMFAALEGGAGAGAGADAGGASDSDGGGAGPAARALEWRPDLRLPGEPRGAAPRAAGLAQLERVPPVDARARLRAARAAAPDTAGGAWFGLPATAMTEEVKADLRLLRLRGAFDPKTFYKRAEGGKFPKHFQFGTVVEGAADFYSSRLTRAQRGATLADELLADERLVASRRRRYNRMQEEKGRWAGKRGAGRKTSNPRLKKRGPKPKH
jgi:hypothetical protein